MDQLVLSRLEITDRAAMEPDSVLLAISPNRARFHRFRSSSNGRPRGIKQVHGSECLVIDFCSRLCRYEAAGQDRSLADITSP
jgi:hypothetical protein